MTRTSRSRASPVPRSRLSDLSSNERTELRHKTYTIAGFSRGFLGVQLRPYQIEAAEAVVQSVFARDGHTFVIIFARQSGKDELLANLILFLLARLRDRGGSIVCAQPTFRPQTLNAMDRLSTRARQRPFFSSGRFHKDHGFIYRFGSASVSYLSADPSANVVGATADRLLIINEAQDVQKGIFDKRFAPMAASGNATRLFSGTAWTVDTLLDREKRNAMQMEKRDGLRRVFIVDGEQVARSNRFYGGYLEQEICKLGRQHPLVRTQYFCENLDAMSGMFTAAHRLLMSCDRPPIDAPSPNRSTDLGSESAAGSAEGPAEGSAESPKRERERIGQVGSITAQRPERVNQQSAIQNQVAFLLDVAGQEESSISSSQFASGRIDLDLNYSRDAVTLRIVEIDLSTLATLQAPTYRVVHTLQWTGLNHLVVFGQLKALGESWRPQHIVMDATGVGEGLWAMLDKVFPTRVIPVKFTQQVKSELGYGFLAIINTGRFKDCSGGQDADQRSRIGKYELRPRPPQEGHTPSRAEIDMQYAACEAEILVGPTKTMRWGVPDGRRDHNGQLIHDDIPVTDSLTAILDGLNWSFTSPALILPARDPLDDMSHTY